MQAILISKGRGMLRGNTSYLWAGLVLVLGWNSPARSDDQLKLLGKAVSDVQEASAMLYTLTQRSDLSVTDILREMKGQGAVSQNWFLSLAQAVADRDPLKAQKECQAIVEQVSEDPTARYWAFCFLTDRQPQLKEPLLEKMLSDPGPELRYEAIELQLKRLKQSPPSTPEEQRSVYSELLEAARLPSQVNGIAELLKEAGAPVDLLNHFGFIAQWYMVGPFDNTGQSGFNVVYGPERDYLAGKISADAKLLELPGYDGKSSSVSWTEYSTTKDDGALDLAVPYKKEKGAIVYALSSFHSAEKLEGEVRIGSQNAVKVWVNGQELISREVYHSGGQIDQYTASVTLNPGANSVMVKVCQNEQTEAWAQDWYFQLRFCDASGLAFRQSK